MSPAPPDPAPPADVDPARPADVDPAPLADVDAARSADVDPAPPADVDRASSADVDATPPASSTPTPTGATSPGRRAGGPRRAVRRPGTVGTGDEVLVSTLPAFTHRDRSPAGVADPRDAPPTSRADGPSPAAGSAAADGRSGDRDAVEAARPRGVPPVERALPLRSLDDGDIGWGGGEDSNDDRLHRDRPPHW